MANVDLTNITPPRVPLIDQRTGLISREWYRFFLNLFQLTGSGQNNLRRTTHHSLQIDLETGVGLNLGQGSDPEVMLRWSDDGGHTWSNYHTSPVGRIGEYYRRTFFRRLGMTLKLRDRVYEVSGTDPVKIAIMGAEVLASGTNA